MNQFKVTLIDGTCLETIKPIKSYAVRGHFTFFYSEENQMGLNLMTVANTQLRNISLEVLQYVN